MVERIDDMEHTDLLPLNLVSHLNRMGGKKRRTKCRRTVHDDRKEMFKESFSELYLFDLS